MKVENILKANLLDIIFDGRNKSYGAYTLRKFYYLRLYYSLGISLVLVLIFSLFISVQKKTRLFPPVPEIVLHPYTISPSRSLEQPIKPADRRKILGRQAAGANRTRESSKKIMFVDDKDQIPAAPIFSDSITSGGQRTATSSHGEPDNGKYVSSGERPGIANPAPAKDKNIPVEFAEVMPSYPGGIDALMKFLQRNLRDPGGIGPGETVSVTIRFIVGYDGNLRGFETVVDGGSMYNSEVIRVLKKMPVWIPGKTSGENISVYFTIPVKFIPE